jgi:hypothetical protein
MGTGMSDRPPVDFTLVVTKPDELQRVLITSPELPGLFIYAYSDRAFADIPGAVRMLRTLNAASTQETSVELIVTDGQVVATPSDVSHCDHGVSLRMPCAECRQG